MWDNTSTNSCGVGGGCGTSGEVSRINKMFIERRCRLQSGRPKWAKRPAARPPWVPVNCWPSPALLAAGLLAHLGQKAGRQTPFEFHCTETSSVSGYQLGANNPLARGEQSDPRTAENAPKSTNIFNL